MEWDGCRVWYEERHLKFWGILKLETNDFTVSIKITNDDGRTVHLGARWDAMYVRPKSFNAHQAGWVVSKIERV